VVQLLDSVRRHPRCQRLDALARPGPEQAPRYRGAQPRRALWPRAARNGLSQASNATRQPASSSDDIISPPTGSLTGSLSPQKLAE
jgi:hypothetical protein